LYDSQLRDRQVSSTDPFGSSHRQMYVKYGYLWNQGVSLTQDRSAGGDVKRFFEALALFSPFQLMTTYLANGHEEGRCMMCHMPQCVQHLFVASDRAELQWLMPCLCVVSDNHSLAAVRGLCCVEQIMHRAVSPSTAGPGP
jgi:hypothetical protein